ADNPNEAPKGREVMTEVFDGSGVFQSTSFATITNRRMLVGQDGRAIHYAYVSEPNELRYDTSPFRPPAGSPVTVPAVVTEHLDAEGAVIAGTVDASRQLGVRGAGAARIRTTFDEVDALGHVRQQTAHGQVEV